MNAAFDQVLAPLGYRMTCKFNTSTVVKLWEPEVRLAA